MDRGSSSSDALRRGEPGNASKRNLPYTPTGREARRRSLRYRFWRLWFKLERKVRRAVES